MKTHYTNSKGEQVEIASLNYHHLKAAHAKAVRTEERRHEEAHQRGGEYENPEREAEIDAMAARLKALDERHAAAEAALAGAS